MKLNADSVEELRDGIIAVVFFLGPAAGFLFTTWCFWGMRWSNLWAKNVTGVLSAGAFLAWYGLVFVMQALLHMTLGFLAALLLIGAVHLVFRPVEKALEPAGR